MENNKILTLKRLIMPLIVFSCFEIISSQLISARVKEKGQTLVLPKLNILQCNDLLKPRLIIGVNTKNQCVRLHTGPECSGNSIEIMPRSPMHSNLQYWGFSNKTASIGPCRSSCDEAVTGKVEDSPLNLTIYNRPDYQGAYLEMKVAGCEQIPLEFTRQLLSVKTFESCFQFYNKVDCQGKAPGVDSIELRKETPFHNDLYYWPMREFKSVSHCRYKCSASKPPEDSNLNPTGTNQVILFSEKRYKGSHTILTVPNSQCVQIKDEWEGAAMSIKINNSCFNLYESKDCDDEEASLNVLSSVEDLGLDNFDEIARSIKSCAK